MTMQRLIAVTEPYCWALSVQAAICGIESPWQELIGFVGEYAAYSE